MQLGEPGVELLGGKRAGGRDDGDAVAGRQRSRLAHAFTTNGGHFVGNRLVLVATEHRAQGGAAQRRTAPARGIAP